MHVVGSDVGTPLSSRLWVISQMVTATCSTGCCALEEWLK